MRAIVAEVPPDGRLARQILAATVIRTILNVSHRMAYPFLPVIARGLGVSITSAGLLMTARSTAGLASPFFGPLSDRLGRRRMMAAGLLLSAAGGAVVALFPRYGTAVVGFGLMGLAVVVFNPSWQAYLGDRVPYARRGRYVALTELAWASSLLIGAPLIGLVIARWGWRAPFGLLAGLTFAGALAMLLVLPGDHRRASDRLSVSSFSRPLKLVLGRRPAVIMLLVTFLLSGSNEVLFVVYGAWMETSFGLAVGALGVATIVIGVAEMLAELGVGGLTDRLGKRRAVTRGLAVTAVAYVALPLISINLRSSLVGLFLVFLCFEFSVVSNLPLASELVPGARGTMMALNVAALSLGRAVAAPLGTALWSAGGLVWNGLAAGAACLLAIGLLVVFVDERLLGGDQPAGV